MTAFLCISEYQDGRIIETGTLIEAVMEFYRVEGEWPDEVSARTSTDRMKSLESEVGVMRTLLDKRTEERDLAVHKLNDILHRVKEAMDTERE